MKVKLTCGIEVSTRQKKNLPHIHKPVECFSVESFPSILPFDPIACPVADPGPVPAASLEQDPIASAEIDQEMDEILEELAEEDLE